MHNLVLALLIHVTIIIAVMVNGFKKLTVGGSPRLDVVTGSGVIRGTRISLHGTNHQTSSGVQSLDLVLGNGINLSSSTLIKVSYYLNHVPVKT